MMKHRATFDDHLPSPTTAAARGLIVRPDCLKMAFRCSLRDASDTQALNTLQNGVEALGDRLRSAAPGAQIDLHDVHVTLEPDKSGALSSKAAATAAPPRRGWGWPLSGNTRPSDAAKATPSPLDARRIVTIQGEVCLPLSPDHAPWARARLKASLAILAQDLWHDGLQHDPAILLAVSPIVALARDPEAHRPALLARWRASLDELARALGRPAERFHLQQLDPPGPVQQTPLHLDAVRLNLPLSGHPHDPLPLTSAPLQPHGAGTADAPHHHDAAPTPHPHPHEAP